MKKTQQGFAVPWVIISIVALLVIGGGVYMYVNNISKNITPPKIDFISYPSGPTGAEINLYGEFKPGDVVYFDSAIMKNANYSPAYSSYCVAPEPCGPSRPAEFNLIIPVINLGTHSISVKRGDQFSNKISFEITGYGPTITSIHPVSGPRGSVITLTGKNFSNDYFVQFLGSTFSGGGKILDLTDTTITYQIDPAAPADNYQVYLDKRSTQIVKSNVINFKITP